MEEHNFRIHFCGKEIPCHYIKSRDKAWKIIQGFLAEDPSLLFGIDTETAPNPGFESYPKAGLSPHLSRIRLIQVYDQKASYVFDCDTIGDNSIFISFLESKRFLAHNAIFEYKFFRKLGAKSINLGCTRILYKIISHAVYADDSGLSASLENICDKLLKEPILKKVQLSNWNEPDLTFEQVEYAAIDPVACWFIGEKLAPGLIKMGLGKIYNITKNAQYPIGEMQLNGMLLDKEKHQTVIHEWRDDLFKAKKELMAFMKSKEVKDSVIRAWLEANLDERTKMFWPRTEPSNTYPDGQLTVNAHTFADFSYLPIVQPLAKFKKLEKLSSTYGDTLLNTISPATGKLHADYNLCGARTGRLSSSYPNLQQYPNQKALRAHFLPSPGNVFVCADYSQIEVRVAAEVSQDTEMLKVYSQGLDIYSATAAKLTGSSLEAIGKKSPERQIAKALVLGLLFGLGAEKFSHYAKKGYNVDVTHEEAVSNIKQFRQIYAGHRAWQIEQSNLCSTSLKAYTVNGKIRALPQDNYYGSCLNHPVQGTAAEIILEALSILHESIKNTGVEEIRFVNCVHDEILLECPPYLAEDVQQLMEACMVEAYQRSFPDGVTRNLVESWIGEDWGAGKD